MRDVAQVKAMVGRAGLADRFDAECGGFGAGDPDRLRRNQLRHERRQIAPGGGELLEQLGARSLRSSSIQQLRQVSLSILNQGLECVPSL